MKKQDEKSREQQPSQLYTTPVEDCVEFSSK